MGHSLLGRLVRLPLRLVPPKMPLWVLSGRGRGLRWLPGSGVHGYWLGTYERESQEVANTLIRQGDVVIDVGANVGYFTLIFSKLTGPNGRVAAIEPVPENLRALRRHLDLNRITNVDVLECAISNASGTAKFATSARSEGRLAARGELSVRVESLDRLVAAGMLPQPSVIKFDIEGGEVEAIEGARSTLQVLKPSLWIETHGWERHEKCRRLLAEVGLDVSEEKCTGNEGFGRIVVDRRI